MVAAVGQPILGVLRADPLGGGLDGFFQGLPGAGLPLAQPSFALAKGQVKGVEVGRVGRQVEQVSAVGFEQPSKALDLVGGQLVEYDHLAWAERGAKHLLQVGGEDRPVDGPAHGQGRPPPARRQGREQRPVRAARQRYGLVHPLPARCAAVPAALGPLRARLVHEGEAGHIPGLPRFHKSGPQRGDPLGVAFGVAFGGVHLFFLRRPPSPCPARPSVARLPAGPATATRRRRNSSRVAAGCWRRQAISRSAAAWGSKGAGPPRGGSAAPGPRTCGRCCSFCPNQMDTWNRAATAAKLLPRARAAATRSHKSVE